MDKLEKFGSFLGIIALLLAATACAPNLPGETASQRAKMSGLSQVTRAASCAANMPCTDGECMPGHCLQKQADACHVPIADQHLFVCDCGPGSHGACVAGDDEASGATPNTAIRTYEEARRRFVASPAPLSVAFCRGGVFEARKSASWSSQACSRERPCLLIDYAAPWNPNVAAAPVIRAVGQHGFFFQRTQVGESAGYFIANLALEGRDSEFGVFLYEGADDVTLCGLSISGFGWGVHVAHGEPKPEAMGERSARINLYDSHLFDNSDGGWLGGCDDCTLYNNYFENNGFGEAIFNHHIYFTAASTEGAAVGMTAKYNRLYRSTNVDGKCQGVAFVAHEALKDILIEGNLLWEDQGGAEATCNGIAIDTGNENEGEHFSKIRITGNVLVNTGSLGIGVNACQSCSIENNVLVMNQPMPTHGIQAPNRRRGPEDAQLDAVRIRNNSILFGPDTHGIAIALGGEGKGHVLANNAIQYAGSGPFSCFSLDLPSRNYQLVDHNLCFFPEAEAGRWEQTLGDLRKWQLHTGMDRHSGVEKPGFSNVNLKDYDLSPASGRAGLVDSGIAKHAPARDVLGNPRPSPPDIGAFEFSPQR